MSNSSGVTFHEDPDLDPIPELRPEPPTLTRRILSMGIAASPGDAAILMAIFAAVLIGVNVFLFAQAIPEPPTLGSDVLRPGEAAPVYIEQN